MCDHPGCTEGRVWGFKIRSSELLAEVCHFCVCGSGKLFNLPGAQFAYLENGDDQGAYLVNYLGGLNEVQVVKCPVSDWYKAIGLVWNTASERVVCQVSYSLLVCLCCNQPF